MAVPEKHGHISALNTAFDYGHSETGDNTSAHDDQAQLTVTPKHRMSLIHSSSPVAEHRDERSSNSVENKGNNKTMREKSTEELPWHHAQLYQLYGQQAEYFLHPKPQQPLPVKQSNPKLRNQKGHIGAEELWETLRKDSKMKLLHNDQRFPHELKAAFSAFVREGIGKHIKPVQRSFCATEDVPDIERLMNQSKLQQTRLYNHKTEIMYRSSLTNKDRTTILLHNSPLPDINATMQPESISRYLPSWIADDCSEVSEAEYMKWLKCTSHKSHQVEDTHRDKKENVRHSAQNRQLDESAQELQNIWQTISCRHKRTNTPHYQFLKEKDAECQGQFTQKFREEKERIEKPHIAKSYLDTNLSRDLSAPPRRQDGRKLQSHIQSEWQPLSMNALVEYKKALNAQGEGEFDNGRIKMWPVVSFS